MSLSLTLYPYRGRRLAPIDPFYFGIDRLLLEHDGWAYCVRDSDKAVKLGVPIEVHDNGGLVEVDCDAHGNPLTWMRAGDLLAVPLKTPEDDEPVVLKTMTKAAMAYLSVLDPDTPVVLWFS